ncbi:hypothetical protein [Streptomyces sp. MZ04]|uniref:hypothetical protein n=1 Tax=Streptomyces sp. MZ04 TaxID=2559236 RepID=UPI00107E85A9|nr:hypothetical protein [Streptomyces sp. MZ04]TGB02118.1 hypothetical protein E2651_26920 [Streptomyces sp. MZ04]
MDLGDDQLDAYIRTRLALAGVDIDQLPEQPDPGTGSPSRAQALSSLRAFVKSTPAALADWTPGGTPAYAQQAAPPLIYPSVAEGHRTGAARRAGA